MTDAPTNIRLLRDARMLEVTWPDGDVVPFPLKHLRCECPCAACVNELTGERMLNPDSIPEEIHPLSLALSGNYALKIGWSDGHESGLYSWDHLARLSAALPR